MAGQYGRHDVVHRQEAGNARSRRREEPVVPLSDHGDPVQLVVADRPATRRRQLEHDAHATVRDEGERLRVGRDVTDAGMAGLHFMAPHELGNREPAACRLARSRPEKTDGPALSQRCERRVGDVVDDDDAELLAERRHARRRRTRGEERDADCRDDREHRQETKRTEH